MISRYLICILLVIFVTVSLVTNCAFASFSKKKTNYLGGIILGAPNGLTLKYYLDDIKALDGVIGIYTDSIELHGTYLWHIQNIISNPSWIPYVGTGLTLRVGGTKNERQQTGTNPQGKPVYENITVAKESLIAVRGTLGILLKYKKWEPFLELVPLLVITPDVKLDINIGIGLRYYFK
ncbi:MAG: hypothetical protein AUJ85_08290 [Elusimicrobia bacterium CG1_02_37_114]|nr:MAG: hypothetical protein AUJ85_08290 [Elusimicrobia bacterium CG1_02_37_114]PIV52309.1 MAG: hypothetical protein COS17_09890 [Elusimicrobia bacterium CG02_land_8_20_14_3_00_37_13]PIZ14431.1 MAG: hypothetical protein COY53_00055 [Elusimicrobia bacterium CG_4_10_14_0_8_um_filter_37_32]